MNNNIVGEPNHCDEELTVTPASAPIVIPLFVRMKEEKNTHTLAQIYEFI
jgi:hypothetical protein